MARKRIIDPSFWSDENIVELDYATRLLFISMTNFSDDNGVIKYSLKGIKAKCFPADNITEDKMQKMIEELLTRKLLIVNEDNTLLKFKNWTIYQKIQKPTPSKYHFVEGNPIILQNHSHNTTVGLQPNRIEKNRIEKNIVHQNNIPNGIDFDGFWNIYPRKVSKKKTMERWNKLTIKDKEDILKVLPKHVKCWESEGRQLEHIKHPDSWLHNRRWEDEVPDTATLVGEYGMENRREKSIVRQQEELDEILNEETVPSSKIKELMKSIKIGKR